MNTKFVFIIGGVLSSLGKGLITSSIALLLKNHKYKVFVKKIDPYLNVDPGTMSPLEHGEVFVTEDGKETDLDLGNYERFTGINASKISNITAGQIYKKVINQERDGKFLGKTVQIIPHVTNLIKDWIRQNPIGAEIIIIEIGGTVGDIELEPFLEAIRQIQIEEKTEDTLINLVGYVPYLQTSQEHKTKPIQHAIKELGRAGIQPSLVFARSRILFNQKTRDKIIMFCNVKSDEVFACIDHESIYFLPLSFHKQELDKSILKNLGLPFKEIDLIEWEEFMNSILETEKQPHLFKIGLVGKYVQLKDAYLSLNEGLKYASYTLRKKIKIIYIDANLINHENYQNHFQSLDGIVVAGGFDKSGFEGKILASKYSREKNIPFLGICFGMHAAAIDVARHLCNLKNANSAEINQESKHLLFSILEGKKNDRNLGGTLRLGNYPINLVKGSLAFSLYKTKKIYERHRHRYEFNNIYIQKFQEAGIIFSGVYQDKKNETDLVEIFELKNHKFFVGCQFHPEFTSRYYNPNPLILGFLQAV